MTDPQFAAEAARGADIWGGDRIYPDGSFAFQCHLAAYLDFARRLPAGARVLDLACGEGYGAAVIAEASPGGVCAIDNEAALLAEAARRYAGARFVAADALGLPFADHSFDAVGALQVIEHLTETSAFLTEIGRVLKPHGFVYLTTPNVDRLPRLARKEFNPHHLRDFTPEELREELGRVFGEVRLYGLVQDPTLPSTRAVTAAAQAEWALIPRVERVEILVRRLPGPLRVRVRRLLLRLVGIPSWPLPEAERARSAVSAEDFLAVEPAEESGCTVAVASVPRTV